MAHILLNTELESVDEAHIAECLTWFPKERVENILKIKYLQGRREKVAAYELLLKGLRERGILESPTIVYDANGKPGLDFATAYSHLHHTTSTDIPHISISHCKVAVAVAISDSPVGIDVEGIRRYSPELGQRIFNMQELQIIESSDNPDREFSRIWTRKEAYLKQTGVGIQSMEQVKRVATCQLPIATQELPNQLGFLSWYEE